MFANALKFTELWLKLLINIIKNSVVKKNFINLIFYQKIGYKFFTQKRDLYLSEELMEKIFRESFLSNLTLNDNEIKFLLKNMLVKVNVIHPVNKTNLVCSGNVNDFELQ